MEDQELSKKEIKKLIGIENPIIFEIGAYDGKDSRELDKFFLNPTIYCFEADKRSQELFENNNNSENIFLIKAAVGNVDGVVEFHLSDSDTRRHEHNKNSWSASSSLRKPKAHLDLFQDVEFKSTCEVECLKLDTWIKDNEMYYDLIDFVWVDINGAEEDFILGALTTLNDQTRFLYIEFSDKELYEGQITKDKILNLLDQFELIGVYNFKGNFGNLLLKNKNFND